jgi:hypothetical protein
MTKVTVTFKSTAATLRASIDDVRLVFTGKKAERNLAAGPHRLTWTVLGKQGDTYSIDLTSPDGASCNGGSEGLNSSGFDIGACKFVIK